MCVCLYHADRLVTIILFCSCRSHPTQAKGNARKRTAIEREEVRHTERTRQGKLAEHILTLCASFVWCTGSHLRKDSIADKIRFFQMSAAQDTLCACRVNRSHQVYVRTFTIQFLSERRTTNGWRKWGRRRRLSGLCCLCYPAQTTETQTQKMTYAICFATLLLSVQFFFRGQGGKCASATRTSPGQRRHACSSRCPRPRSGGSSSRPRRTLTVVRGEDTHAMISAIEQFEAWSVAYFFLVCCLWYSHMLIRTSCFRAQKQTAVWCVSKIDLSRVHVSEELARFCRPPVRLCCTHERCHSAFSALEDSACGFRAARTKCFRQRRVLLTTHIMFARFGNWPAPTSWFVSRILNIWFRQVICSVFMPFVAWCVRVWQKGPTYLFVIMSFLCHIFNAKQNQGQKARENMLLDLGTLTSDVYFQWFHTEKRTDEVSCVFVRHLFIDTFAGPCKKRAKWLDKTKSSFSRP